MAFALYGERSRAILVGKDPSHMATDKASIRGVDNYLEAHRADFEEQLKALLRVPERRATASA